MMCGDHGDNFPERQESHEKVPREKAVVLNLAHDNTEIQPGDTKRRVYKRGHIVKQDNIEYFLRLEKENLP